MELIGVGTEAKLDVAVHQVVIEYARTIRKLQPGTSQLIKPRGERMDRVEGRAGRS